MPSIFERAAPASPAPPPLPGGSHRRPTTAAVWSLALAGFAWAALLTLQGVVSRYDVLGYCVLVLLAPLCVSMALALTVLLKRRRGAILAIFALGIAALPFWIIVSAALRATFKPSGS